MRKVIQISGDRILVRCDDLEMYSWDDVVTRLCPKCDINKHPERKNGLNLDCMGPRMLADKQLEELMRLR